MAIYPSCNLTTIDRTIIANSFGIYDNNIYSTRAFMVHIYFDLKETFKNDEKLNFGVNKLKSLCEKK